MQSSRLLPRRWYDQIQQRLKSLPPLETEESIALRAMVQVLVAVGIIATDVAGGTGTSFWAIPLSFAGGVWSWRSRHKRNVAAKFFIAIGMLVALMAFFVKLFENLNDTRLVLAELLIQLQVFHSFDLPRRKDLGYSMVIALILLGVAATVSETLAFGPLLVLFLAVALPVLVLDYRSRLGFVDRFPHFSLKKQKSNLSAAPARQYPAFSLKRLALLLLAIIPLGLAIFTLMPRFPGYQQYTFPVSGAAELESARFNENNRGIYNPGVRSGSGTGDGQNGSGGTEAAEDGNGDIYYGFRSEIDQGLAGGGRLNEKTVFRVRSQAPGFWRVLGFDRYTGRGWAISRDEKLTNVERSQWSYQFFLSPFLGRGETRQVIQTYTILEPLPNLVPALYQAKNIYFPTPEIAIDAEGGLRSPATLGDNLAYTVVSEVPHRDRTALARATTKYPKNIRDYYLDVPPTIRAKVRAKAEELLNRSPKPITAPYEKTLWLAQALKQNYQVFTNLPPLGENEDLVDSFLFRYQGGYPDHFPTVLAVMLRSLGIPARVATGYGTGQFNAFTGFYLVKNTDAYTIAEVFFANYGWFSFDPVPGHPLTPPSFEEYETFGVLRQFWNWIAGWLPSPVTAFLSLVWQKISGAIAQLFFAFWRLVSGSWFGFILGLILLACLSFLGWILGNNWQNWRYRRKLAKMPAMERIYQQMLDSVARRTAAKQPAQTPLEYARSTRVGSPEADAIIDEISQAYVRWRYGEEAQNTDYLTQQLRALTRNLRRSERFNGNGDRPPIPD